MTDIKIPEGFTRWDGSIGGVPNGVFDGDVEVIHRCGDVTKGRFDQPEDWADLNHDYDIIAYRVIE